jgi:type VI secretion system Hcp family effector
MHQKSGARIAAVAAAAAVWLASAAVPAGAAYEFYVTIEGAKQGLFHGEGRGRDTGRMPGTRFSYELAGPPQAAAPRPGQHREGRITFVKDTNAASPQLLRALATHELLTRVDFEFVRAAAGRDAVYKTLHLGGALVAAVRTLGGGGGHPLEQVTLVFDQARLESRDAQATPIPFDRWVSIEK